MKAVLISIKPKWCELIASGEKTVEVRKTRPKIDTPFKVYIYCTIDGGVKGDRLVKSGITCGKVIGEFVCDKIVKFENSWYEPAFGETADLSCLGWEELALYLGGKDYGYGWHISDLVIYDKPRELRKFHKPCTDIENCLNRAFRESGRSLDKCFDCGCQILRPPQSWMYVESEDNK